MILSICRLLGAVKSGLMRTWREILKLQHPNKPGNNFLLGSASMTLSIIVLFLGRKKTKETHPTSRIEGYRPWFDKDS